MAKGSVSAASAVRRLGICLGVVAILIVLGACEGSPPEREPAARAVTAAVTATPPPLHIIDLTTANQATVQSDRIIVPTGAQLRAATTAATAQSLSALAPGDVIVSDYGANNPFLRKVSSVSTSGSLVTIMTTNAAIDEVLGPSDYHVTINQDSGTPVLSGGGSAPRLRMVNVNGSPVTAAPLAAGSSVGGLLGGKIDFTGKVLNVAQGKATITIKDGHLNFTPNLDIGFNVDWFKLNEFHAIASGTVDAKLELDAKVAVGGALPAVNITLLKDQIFFEDFIGPVPVEETLVYTATLKCELDPLKSMEIDAGAAAVDTVQIGARYQNGSWSPVASNNFNLNIIGPTFSNEASTFVAKCALRPRLDLLFYNTAGPGMYVEGYVQFQDTQTSCGSWGPWNLSYGIDGAVAFKVQVFDFQLADYSLKLFDFNTPLGSGPGQSCGTGSSSGSGSSSGGSGSGSGSSSGGSSGSSSGGSGDPCSGTSSDGYWCGQSTQGGFLGGATNWLYHCVNHATALETFCDSGCIVAPAGTADYCSAPANPCSAVPPANNGIYCGASRQSGFAGGSIYTLYTCTNGATTSTQLCEGGQCIVAPSGQNDSCPPPPNNDPCRNVTSGNNGIYCGASTQAGFAGGDPYVLYDCENGSAASKTLCTSGTCIVAPPGQPDACPGSSSSCAGTVCGQTCCPSSNFCGPSQQCCDGVHCGNGCPC